MFGLGGGEMGLVTLIFFVLFLIPFVLTLWAFVDVLKNEFTGHNKLIWALVILFLAPLGCILYYFIGRTQKIQPAAA